MNEVTTLMEATEARRRLDRIRKGLEDMEDEVLALWRGQGWLALGYQTWAEMNQAELPFRLAIPKEERPTLVGSLKSEGMSGPAIGEALGISEFTVRKDLASINHEPVPTVGLDGKTYSPRQPKVIDPYENWTEDEQLIRKQLEADWTVVISLRPHHERVARWAEQQDRFVKIDRRTDWGNPFEIPDDGDRGVVIAKYEQHYLPHKTALRGRLNELQGKALACWCAPEPCHGDVLKQWAER